MAGLYRTVVNPMLVGSVDDDADRVRAGLAADERYEGRARAGSCVVHVVLSPRLGVPFDSVENAALAELGRFCAVDRGGLVVHMM